MNAENLYKDHLTELRKRHDRALQSSGFDAVAIYSGAEHGVFLDDQSYPFKPNPHFTSWVPLKVTNSFVVYQAGKKPVLIYFQPVDYWYMPPEDPEGFWVEHFDIRIIANAEDAKKQMPSGGRTAFIGEWDDSFASWGLGEKNPKALLDELHYHRAWKTDYELECIRLATIAGVRGHKAAEKAFFSGASEFEIHVEYLRTSGMNEADLQYGNIVAFNRHAAVLHYQHQDREPLPEADRFSFLIDAGALYNGYGCDITRTYAAKHDEFAELVSAMDEMQLRICDEIRPGVDYKNIHLGTHQKIAELLQRFDFVKLDPAAIVEKKISSVFLPHGIGHYLGLQVHDVGGFSADEKGTTIPKPEGHPYLRLTRVIEERHAFTIEPGLYFIPSLLAELRERDEAKYVNWEKVDDFRKYGGIRIEDNLVVTADGHENMTRNEWARK